MWGMGQVWFTPEMGFMFAMLDRFDNVFDIISIKKFGEKHHDVAIYLSRARECPRGKDKARAHGYDY